MEGEPWGGAGVSPKDEEVNPVNLAALFAVDRKKDQGLQRAVQIAGSGLDDEFELKKLQVFVRIRPSVTKGAPRWDTENCIHATSKCSIAIAPPEASQAYKNGDRGQTFSFTRVFDEQTAQQDYFDSTAAPLVKDLLRDKQHNSVMMAYGITAAGKTYTIEGSAQQPGVMPRALEMLFQGLQEHVEAISVRVAYYEVYNEQVYDLLEDASGGPGPQRVALKLKEDNQGRVFVAGLSEVEVTSATEALKVLRRGSKQRQRAETGLNYSSSRSHSIFTVMLYQPQAVVRAVEGAGELPEDSEHRLGRLSFVDLAGSERAQRTGNVGVRLKESVAINSSLMMLGRCLEALRWNQQHKNGNLKVVPYRESKVTHLFRDALHGWGQVVLSVNVSPCAKDYDETAHVLKYAALATQIGTIQQVEAPRRVVKAVSPNIKKVKRKAQLPPEARAAKVKVKRAKKSPGKQAAEEQHQASPAPEHGAPVEGLSGDECAAAGDYGQQEYEEDVAGIGYGVEQDVEFDGTPNTPLDDDGGDSAVAELQAHVQELVSQLQKAEERCVLVETEVREEVAHEMEQLLREMEANYKERLSAEVAQLEHRLASAQQAGAGALRRGKGRGKANSELGDDADSVMGQWETLLAAADQKAARLQQQIDSLQQEVTDFRQQAQELQAALDQGNQQAAVQQDQIAQLQQQVTTAHQLAAAAEQQCIEQRLVASSLQAELVQLAAQRAALQAELETERQKVAAQAAEAQDMQVQAAQQLESTLQEEMTQMEANRAMEVEMLEEQLHRAKKDNAALKQRLEAAMATLATMASPSISLMQRMAQACPAGNGRGAGGTPHDVALARARQAAADEELEQAAAATAAEPGKRSKASGQGRTRFAGVSGRQLPAASQPTPQVQPPPDAQAQPGSSPAQAEQQQEAGAEVLDPEQPCVAESCPSVDGAEQLQPHAALEGAEAPAGMDAEPPHREAGVEPAPAPAAESKRARRTTRASGASAASADSRVQGEVSRREQEPPAAAKPTGQARRGRRATQAAPAALAPISEAEELCAEGQGAGEAHAPAAAAEPQDPNRQADSVAEVGLGASAGPSQQQPEQQAAAAGEQHTGQQSRKVSRKGRRRTTAAGHTAPELAEAAACGAEQQHGGKQQAAGLGGPDPEEVVQQQPAAARQGRQGRHATVSTLGSIDEEAPVAVGSHAAGEAAGEGQQDGGPAPSETTIHSRRASYARRTSRHSNKENEASGAAVRRAVGNTGKEQFAASAEEEATMAQATAEQRMPDAEVCHQAPQPTAVPTMGKPKRKLLPAQAETKEMKRALGEWNDDVPLGAVSGGAAAQPRRPRRQTQFYRL